MRTEQSVSCPNCQKQIIVVFDSEYYRDDHSRGDYVLDGRHCWNCGVSYPRLFSGSYKTSNQLVKKAAALDIAPADISVLDLRAFQKMFDDWLGRIVRSQAGKW